MEQSRPSAARGSNVACWVSWVDVLEMITKRNHVVAHKVVAVMVAGNIGLLPFPIFSGRSCHTTRQLFVGLVPFWIHWLVLSHSTRIHCSGSFVQDSLERMHPSHPRIFHSKWLSEEVGSTPLNVQPTTRVDWNAADCDGVVLQQVCDTFRFESPPAPTTTIELPECQEQRGANTM